MKYSKQREAILQAILWSNEHPTAEMVYQAVRKEIPNISLGTVYRNLNLLVEQGMIKQVLLPNEGNRFEKTLESHDHVYCQKCKSLFDIPSSNLENINKRVERETGFQIMSQNIIFEGICKNCRQEKLEGDIYGIKRI